jgi:hypothetical protein
MVDVDKGTVMVLALRLGEGCIRMRCAPDVLNTSSARG